MVCFIYKWFISRALDLGQGLPGFVTRHIHRCKTCREFSHLSEMLNQGLVKGASQFLRESKRDDSLNEKILSALAAKPGLVLPKRRTFLSAAFPVPVLAAAVVVLVATIGIILQTIPSRVLNTGQDLMNGLSEFGIKKTSLQDIVGRVESPLEAEMQELKQSVNSAAEFLISNLDIRIDQPTTGYNKII